MIGLGPIRWGRIGRPCNASQHQPSLEGQDDVCRGTVFCFSFTGQHSSGANLANDKASEKEITFALLECAAAAFNLTVSSHAPNCTLELF